MSSRRRPSSAPPPPPSRAPQKRRSVSRLEYRSPADGAWYGVRLVIQDAALRVMYEDFHEEVDEWYEAGQFASAAEVEELRARFRARSPPLEDSQCRTVGRGTAVCVSCPLQSGELEGGELEGGELKFFDAVIDSVSSAHECVDGEDRCHCKFLVVWKDGPYAGSRSEVSIERICHIPNFTEDPILSEFFDSAFKLLENKGNGKAQSVSLATPVHEMKASSHQEVHGSEDSSLPKSPAPSPIQSTKRIGESELQPLFPSSAQSSSVSTNLPWCQPKYASLEVELEKLEDVLELSQVVRHQHLPSTSTSSVPTPSKPSSSKPTSTSVAEINEKIKHLRELMGKDASALFGSSSTYLNVKKKVEVLQGDEYAPRLSKVQASFVERMSAVLAKRANYLQIIGQCAKFADECERFSESLEFIKEKAPILEAASARQVELAQSLKEAEVELELLKERVTEIQLQLSKESDTTESLRQAIAQKSHELTDFKASYMAKKKENLTLAAVLEEIDQEIADLMAIKA